MSIVSKDIRIKNMVCHCCSKIIKQELESINIEVLSIDLGCAEIKYNNELISEEKIDAILKNNGFQRILDRDQQIVEQIKIAVIELIHYLNNMDSIVRKSEYIVEKLGMSYQQLSKIFSKHEKTTLEKYIILNKIERIKELIISDEYTISEIAYMMDYSSVQYLSNQFKNITGISISEFKQLDKPGKKGLDKLI